MIGYDPDGFTLHYTGADGKPATETPANWKNYVALLAISDQQKQAARDNTQSQAAYLTACGDYAKAPEKSVLPVKPLMIVVNDQGVESKVAFVPALPDPVTFTPVGSGGGIASKPATDRTDVILAVSMANAKLLQKIADKLGVVA